MSILFNRNFLITVLILLVISFTMLSIFVSHHLIWKTDIEISLFCQKYQSYWLDQVMLAISFFGELPFSLISVLLVAAVFYWQKYKREAYFMLLVLLSGLIILGVKNIINRPRPTSFYVRLVEVNHFQSYPSGHTLSYVLFFGFLMILMGHLKSIPKTNRIIIGSISAFLMFMIAPSRIYLGAHWFTDTVGGFLLGLICLYPLCYFYFKPAGRKQINNP